MPARLHHERIARADTTPARWLVMTHGIYGAGGNWRGIARKITERRPEWGIVLVDLRQHGRSEPGDPPHTVAACADDLAAVIGELGAHALAGHSFGGKVALATRARVQLHQTWVLDASPSARAGAMTEADNTVVRVLELMERLPKTWTRREDFVTAVVAAGHDAGLAQWLAQNVVPDGDGLALRLDLAALRALLVDYYTVDLWPAVDLPAGALEIVIATRSAAVSDGDREHLAASPPHVRVHHIDAGHWLHIEAASAVVELFAKYLP